jgi:hypothetical protein
MLMPGEASAGGLGVNGASLVELAAWVAAFAEGLVGQAFDDAGAGTIDAGVGAGDYGAQVVFVPVALFCVGQSGWGGDVGVAG